MQLPFLGLPKGEDSLVVRMSRLGAERRNQNKGLGGGERTDPFVKRKMALGRAGTLVLRVRISYVPKSGSYILKSSSLSAI